MSKSKSKSGGKPAKPAPAKKYDLYAVIVDAMACNPWKNTTWIVNGKKVKGAA